MNLMLVLTTPEMRARLMLEARRLVKRYYGHAVVDHVSFAVHRGEVVGYLGPNGSGKTPRRAC